MDNNYFFEIDDTNTGMNFIDPIDQIDPVLWNLQDAMIRRGTELQQVSQNQTLVTVQFFFSKEKERLYRNYYRTMAKLRGDIHLINLAA